MGLHGALAEEQGPGDLGVGHASCDQPQDLGLPVGEDLEPVGGGALARPLPDELLHQPPSHRGGEQRLPGRGDPDRTDQILRRSVLEQEPARSGRQRVVDVLIEVVGGEDHHPRSRGWSPRGDPAGGLDPIHPGHPDVHQHHLGEQRLIVGDEYPDGHGSLASAGVSSASGAP